MAKADQFVEEIYCWIQQVINYADKLKELAEELDSGSGGRKTQEHLTEAENILKSSNKTVASIQKLFEELKGEKLNSNPDPEKLHQHILTDVLVALGIHTQLEMSSIDHLPEKLIKCLEELGFSHILKNVCVVLIIFNLETGSESLWSQIRISDMEASGGVTLVGAATEYFRPEEINSWRDQIENNHVTEASRSLRSRAMEILEIIRTLWKKFSIIEKSLKYLFIIRGIKNVKKQTEREKRALIDYAIENSQEEEVKQWFRDNPESDAFFHLLNFACIIQQNLRRDLVREEEGKKIELIFLAHGSIENRMIPAKCLLPSTSITDVVLYSPWNCLLTTTAAYSIATGSIRPDHRQFECKFPTNQFRWPFRWLLRWFYPCRYPEEAHTPPDLPRNWNSINSSVTSNIPNIMVSPVGKPGDRAFEAFIALEMYLGEPAANRYVIPYLASWIGEVPFFIVMLAISMVVSFSEYEVTVHEVTVHLAACLGKSPRKAVMQEEELRRQYAYTVDNTKMTVPIGTIPTKLRRVFEMFRAVFGD